MVRAGEHLPDWGRGPLKRTAALIPPGIRGKTLLERMATRLRHRYIGNAHVYADPEVDAITRHDGPPVPGKYATAASITEPIFAQADQAGLDDVSAKQLVDINTWLAGDILVKADRMTMAHSLELRVPYLDREVMAVAMRLARREKIGPDDHEGGAASGSEPSAAHRSNGAGQAGFPRPHRPVAERRGGGIRRPGAARGADRGVDRPCGGAPAATAVPCRATGCDLATGLGSHRVLRLASDLRRACV